MKAPWIVIGIIALIAIIYWFYNKNKTITTVVAPISPRNVANTAPLTVTYAQGYRINDNFISRTFNQINGK